MRIATLFISTLISISLLAEKQTPQEYIDKYKDMAIVEMHRSGVPASITLAQGILESSSGNSRLAKYANNHFGIKCKGNWEGDVIYANDDAPNECFRAYKSVEDSYRDHSDFLRSNWRYHPLFELSRTDYKGWCKGLRKAGYATNPKYHTILINLIERYELQEYDTKPLPHIPSNPLSSQSINNVPVMYASEGQTVSSIAEANDLRDKHIRKWNDLPKGAEINEGDLIYLKPKRRRGSEESHVVKEGETMHDISQKYGIKLKHLYKKNRMERGTEPAVGESLAMRKKISRDETIDIATPTPEWEEPKEFVNPHSLVKKQEVDTSNAGPLNVKDMEIPDSHIVVKGDNIYRIAEKYRVFEEDLLVWNKDLNPNALKIDQVIYLSKEAAKKAETLQETTTQETETAEITSEEELKKIEEEITVSGPVFHKVVKGDTVYNICKRYGITQDQLKTWNSLDSLTIKIDQQLQVSE